MAAGPASWALTSSRELTNQWNPARCRGFHSTRNAGYEFPSYVGCAIAVFGGSRVGSAAILLKGGPLAVTDLWQFSLGQWTWVKGANAVGQAGAYGIQANPGRLAARYKRAGIQVGCWLLA